MTSIGAAVGSTADDELPPTEPIDISWWTQVAASLGVCSPGKCEH